MPATQSRVPPKLKAGIAALMIAIGGGYATYTHIDGETTALLRNQYGGCQDCDGHGRVLREQLQARRHALH